MTSWGSGGLGRRCLQTATIPATIIEVTTTDAAAITAAKIIIVECCFCLSWFDVSAGVGSSDKTDSSVYQREKCENMINILFSQQKNKNNTK